MRGSKSNRSFNQVFSNGILCKVSAYEIEPKFPEALLGTEIRHGESLLWRVGRELIVITWLQEAPASA
jgi:hypothetical protein